MCVCGVCERERKRERNEKEGRKEEKKRKRNVLEIQWFPTTLGKIRIGGRRLEPACRAHATWFNVCCFPRRHYMRAIVAKNEHAPVPVDPSAGRLNATRYFVYKCVIRLPMISFCWPAFGCSGCFSGSAMVVV